MASLADSYRLEKKRKYEQRLKNKIEWITFYRRNWHIFAERVLGIKLKPYQQIFLWMMGNSDTFYSLCSRGSGKTFLTAIAAVCKMCLYPYSEIVISASTEAQASQLVTSKIKGELIDKMSPYLRLMFKSGYLEMRHTDTGGWMIANHLNHSTITACAPIDSSRGMRATCLILDEHRLMKSSAVAKILMPMLRPRQAAYRSDPKYGRRKRWIEEGQVFYLTSTGYKFEPFWRVFKNCFVQHFKSKRLRYNICAIDIYVSIKYGIKSLGDLEKARQEEDITSFQMEYLNITVGAIQDGYFGYEMFVPKQVNAETFIPPTDEQVRRGTQPEFRFKNDFEVRVIAVDFAFANTNSATANDNTIIICASIDYDNGVFLRRVDYITLHPASDTIGGSDRIRKLYHDYEADFIVFDSRSGGEVIYNHFTEQLDCIERGNNWCNNGLTVADVRWHRANAQKLEDYKLRTVDQAAIPCLIPYLASVNSNTNMWISMRKALENNVWSFPIPMKQKEDMMFNDGSYFTMESDEIASILEPYGQMDLLVAEAVNLRSVIQNGQVRLQEPRNMTKDRIVALSYCNDIMDSIENEMRQSLNIDEGSICDAIDFVW